MENRYWTTETQHCTTENLHRIANGNPHFTMENNIPTFNSGNGHQKKHYTVENRHWTKEKQIRQWKTHNGQWKTDNDQWKTDIG